jgi:hypothetical protein
MNSKTTPDFKWNPVLLKTAAGKSLPFIKAIA